MTAKNGGQQEGVKTTTPTRNTEKGKGVAWLAAMSGAWLQGSTHRIRYYAPA